MGFMGNGITNCYPDEVDKFISITVLTIDDTATYLREHWPTIREQLLNGTYTPKPVKRVDIPKPAGGVRRLGVPCVVDRLLQQALLQVLQVQWDPTFSEHSYGFRPGRSAHQAVAQAQAYVADGYDVVVDIDLEKFFDRVNQDRLMARVAGWWAISRATRRPSRPARGRPRPTRRPRRPSASGDGRGKAKNDPRFSSASTGRPP